MAGRTALQLSESAEGRRLPLELLPGAGGGGGSSIDEEDEKTAGLQVMSEAMEAQGLLILTGGGLT